MSDKQGIIIDTPSGGFIAASAFNRAEAHEIEGKTFVNVWMDRAHVATYETDSDGGMKFMFDARKSRGLA